MFKAGFAIVSCGAALALFASCGGGLKTDRPLAQKEARIYAVSTDSAAFYSHGPQQGNGPDRTLPRDTLVKLIRPSFGYSKVQLVENSQQGYVASENIRLAPATLVASAKATPAPLAAASIPPADQFELNSADPRLSAPPEQLPPPDLPPTSADPAAAAPSPIQQ